MYKKFSVLIIFAFICISLFSCRNSSNKNALEENETEVEKEEVWSNLEKVSDIYGKIADNTPLVPLTNLYSSGVFNQIFVVYLDNTPSKYLSSENPELNLLEIIPSEELGGLFEGTTNFKRSKIEHLIRLGYKDTVKIMKDNKRYPVSSYWFE